MIRRQFQHSAGHNFAGLKPSLQDSPERAALGKRDDGGAFQGPGGEDWAVPGDDQRRFHRDESGQSVRPVSVRGSWTAAVEVLPLRCLRARSDRVKLARRSCFILEVGHLLAPGFAYTAIHREAGIEFVTCPPPS